MCWGWARARRPGPALPPGRQQQALWRRRPPFPSINLRIAHTNPWLCGNSVLLNASHRFGIIKMNILYPLPPPERDNNKREGKMKHRYNVMGPVSRG